jgi:hypothetical protein
VRLRTSFREGLPVNSRIAKVLGSVALLVLAQQATAQDWTANPAAQQSPGLPQPVMPWPELHKDKTQTWVGIRHNDTDGTTVGVGVRSAAYPSMLIELEVVPPGYGPEDKDEKPVSSPLPSDNPQLRTIHRLSLRYRF